MENDYRAVDTGTIFELNVGADLYTNNPFRVLELPTDCTSQDLTRRQKMIEIAAKNDLPLESGSGSAFPLATKHDPYYINNAVEQLMDPQKRFFSEFFWFWPAEFGKSSQDEALQALKEGDIDFALQYWNDQSNAVSKHNMAIISHLLALDTENQINGSGPSNTQSKSLDSYWPRAYKRWQEFRDDQSSWDYVLNRVRILEDPRLTPESVQVLKDSLPLALLSINATLAVQNAEKADRPEMVHRHKRMIQSSGMEASLQERAISNSLHPIETRIMTLTAQSERDAKADPIHADKISQRLLEQCKPLLSILNQMLDSNSTLYQSLYDEVALKANVCIIAFGNKTESWASAIKLLEEAAPLAVSSSAKEKLNNNLKQCRENNKSGSSWYGAGYFDQPEPILGKLEAAHEQYELENYAQAIEILEALRSQVPESNRMLVDKPLATALNSKALKKFNTVMEPVTQDRKIIKNIVRLIDTSGSKISINAAIQGNDRLLAQAGMLHCTACGSLIRDRWATLTYKDVKFIICMSCNYADDADLTALRAPVKSSLPDIYAILLRASQLDPSNTNVQSVMTSIKKMASDMSVYLGPLTTTPAKPTPVSTPAPARTTTPKAATATPTSFTTKGPADHGLHILSLIIDGILVMVLSAFWMSATSNPSYPSVSPGVAFIYMLAFHAIFKRTIGEMATSCQVVGIKNNKKIDFGEAFLRSVIYFTMVCLLFYLPALGWLTFIVPIFNAKRRGLHDFLSGTLLAKV